MGYLITQIIICLLIAALIGFIIGWLLRGIGCKNQEDNQQAGSLVDDSSAINTLSSVDAVDGANTVAFSESGISVQIIHHKIENIEGIGGSIGNHLRNIEVKTTGDLLKKCSIDSGFQQVVEVAGVTGSVVTQWVSMADLMRVPGVDGQFSELMEASDIKSVLELAQADANALTVKMQIVNQRENKIPDSIELPSVGMVADWIRDAKSIV
jgi:hypothetical protein